MTHYPGERSDPRDGSSPKGRVRLIEDVVGVILAGGKSSRYGRNKALERLDGVPLIERVLGVMGSTFSRVIIVTNTPEYYEYLNAVMSRDLIKGLGPLGGIYTALTLLRDEAAFVVACDMPCLNPELIRYMVDRRGDCDGVVPRFSGYVEALHALYEKSCLPAVRELIDLGHHQVLRFFSSVSIRYVEENEIRTFDPDMISFVNINRPQDMSRYLAAHAEGRTFEPF